MTSSKRKDLIAMKVQEWPASESFGLSGDDAAHYEALRRVLIRYSQGMSAATAAAEENIARSEIYRMIARAAALDSQGYFFGHRALIKNSHVYRIRKNSSAKLNSKTPLSGSFELLLHTHPKIKKVIDDLIIGKRHPEIADPLPEVPFAVLATCFRKACLDAGLQAPSYPFNARNEGRSALRRYRQELDKAKALGEQAQQDFLRSRAMSKGDDYYAPYARVEADGYWMDVDIEVEFNGREPGSVVRIPVTRIWILALIEQASSACLGYSLAFGKNYAASDLLAAVRNSMIPWTPLKSDSEIAYGVGDGFPSMHEELSYMCFDELHLDNAASHLSQMSLASLERNCRAVPVFGPVASPRFRPQVEGCFAILQTAATGYWKSTGRIPFSVLRHAVDAILGAFNNSRAPGSTDTRMQTLRAMVAAALTMNRRVPLNERASLSRYDLVDRATVGKDGSTRVLRWKNARYHGSGLRALEVGDKVVLYGSSQDPREIRITCERTGRELGFLHVERRWRGQPLDVRARKWLGNDAEFRRLTEQGADITLALYKLAGEKGGGQAAQHKRAVIAQGLPSVPPSGEPSRPPQATREHGDRSSGKSEVDTDGSGTASSASLHHGASGTALGSTRSNLDQRLPAARDLKHTSQTFVSKLLQDIESL